MMFLARGSNKNKIVIKCNVLTFLRFIVENFEAHLIAVSLMLKVGDHCIISVFYYSFDLLSWVILIERRGAAAVVR